MKGLNRLLAIPGMFLLVIVLLITSFQLVIYGDPSYRFYEKEYEKYHVTASLHMSMEDVMEVTEHMMDYLVGKEEKLSIVTDVDGREQDFFNEQDRLHMADVKNLFSWRSEASRCISYAGNRSFDAGRRKSGKKKNQQTIF